MAGTIHHRSEGGIRPHRDDEASPYPGCHGVERVDGFLARRLLESSRANPLSRPTVPVVLTEPSFIEGSVAFGVGMRPDRPRLGAALDARYAPGPHNLLPRPETAGAFVAEAHIVTPA